MPNQTEFKFLTKIFSRVRSISKDYYIIVFNSFPSVQAQNSEYWEVLDGSECYWGYWGGLADTEGYWWVLRSTQVTAG